MFDFKPVQLAPQRLHDYTALFGACFPHAEKFNPAFLKWLYADNPDGCAIGFDAYDNSRLAAHYVCIPTRVVMNGAQAPALLSLNTATHPSYQGKGLFTKLAEMTYCHAAEHGFHSVYGVANANSTPGFIRKLGFQLVEPLQALVGVGRLGFDMALARKQAQFRRVWSPAALAWRCANPDNPVSMNFRTGECRFHAKALGSVLAAYAELPEIELDRPAVSQKRIAAPGRLFLGLVPTQAGGFATYASIPRRLRPSPLNLVYRPLATDHSRLAPGQVFFNFLDFDAY